MYSLRFSLKTQKFLIALALTALVWIVFAQTAHFDWVRYDDRDYVYGSARVTSGLSFSNIAWAFTHFQAANWHPITTLSHMLDCQLFGVNPGLHHFSSVVIHTLAVIALFFALDSLTGKIWRSGVVAGGINPILYRTLAAAYAESGRFDDAIATAERGREFAEREGNRELADEFTAVLAGYRQHQPFRDASLELHEE